MGLSDYALTESQEEIARLYDEGLSSYAIGDQLGKAPANVRSAIRKMEARAAQKGDDPEHGLNRSVPDGYKLKGFSDMRTNEEGKPIWYKVDQDKERQIELLREAVEALKEDLPRESIAPPCQSPALNGLCNVHILTDLHMGMLSWSEETDGDWDTNKAESLLMAWMNQAIHNAPDAECGVLANLSDFLHYDSLESVTPNSGHQLDADTRYAYLVRVAMRSLRKVVRMMLEKYPHVHLLVSDANHDPSGGIWLREMFAQFFDDEPRLTVDHSPSTYNCFEWGKTSIFFHHGHKKKLENVADVFAAQFREVFGRTKYSYAHIGHLHHIAAKETNLMVVEQHRTMAPKDAYAASGGYLSGRSADVITYSAEYGQVGRQTLTPEMVG